MNHATPTRFSELCRRVGIADMKAENIFVNLVAHYAEDHRKYHNLSHIDRMLAWLAASGESIDSVELAIWFHDVIYNPLGSHNEAKSARYFTDHLGTFISGPLAIDVERLIMATDSTRPRTGRDDENLIIDIDLSILGTSPEEYTAYREAIRCEYSAVPDAEFLAGRRAILQNFLAQQIFTTTHFSHLEKQARANIQNEIDSLKSNHTP